MCECQSAVIISIIRKRDAQDTGRTASPTKRRVRLGGRTDRDRNAAVDPRRGATYEAGGPQGAVRGIAGIAGLEIGARYPANEAIILRFGGIAAKRIRRATGTLPAPRGARA